MMYNSEWSFLDKGHILGEEARNGVYLRELYHLFELHIRKYSSKRLGKHGLTASWWSLHEEIVSSSSSDEKRSFCMFLSDNMGEVH